MIIQRIFPRLPVRLPRFCDVQAWAVKNFEAASQRHAAGLAKERIASPDGDDPSDGEDASDGPRGGAEPDQLPVRQEAAVSTPNRKGKEKVGASEVGDDIPVFYANVPETPSDPTSDLNPRASKGKRSAESTPDHAVRPPKQASMVVQYVVSSDEEGAGEPVLAEIVPTRDVVSKAPVEGVTIVVPLHLEEANEPNVSVSTSPRQASHPAAANEPNIFAGHPGPSDQPGPSNQPGASMLASGLGVTREGPPVGLAEAGEGSSFVSLSDFSATEICSHLINHDVYIAEKLSIEESYVQQLAQLRDSIDGFLSAQLATEEKLSTTEEKLSATEEEIRSLKQQLSVSQDSLAARFEAERLAEKAREKAERESQDLMRQSKKFFAMKDHSNEKALRRFDKSLQLHMDNAMGSIKEQIKHWKAHCRYSRIEPHPMHLEVPTKRAFNTYYSGKKGSLSSSGDESDMGLISGRDYGPFMP
ncbi:hypothetical protein Q3G72_021207 [Acer saccharum]|nr:hypothetical protein Q3G72_021207 [Acer saccharum]